MQCVLRACPEHRLSMLPSQKKISGRDAQRFTESSLWDVEEGSGWLQTEHKVHEWELKKGEKFPRPGNTWSVKLLHIPRQDSVEQIGISIEIGFPDLFPLPPLSPPPGRSLFTGSSRVL